MTCPVDWVSDPFADDDETCGKFFEDGSSWEPGDQEEEDE